MDKIIEKIKKCLALAQSSNANEAAAALRQAQKLMEAHGITQQDIDLSELSGKTTASGSARNPAKYTIYLTRLICIAFGVEMILKPKINGCDVEFIGIGFQPEIASYAFEVLLRQLVRDRKTFMATLHKNCKANTKTRKADIFAEHWVLEALRKVQEFAKPTNFDDLVSQYIENEHGSTSQAKLRGHKKTNQDGSAALAGRIAGKNAQLHHGMNGQQMQRIN